MTTTNRKQHEQLDLEGMMGGPEIFDNDGPIWVNKFTEDSARVVVKQIQYQSSKNPEAPIVMYIDSYGGEVYSLLTMLSAMEAVPNQIITVAFGKAMSCGALLLAHGDIRYAAPHSTVMVHEISSSTGGHVSAMVADVESAVRLNEKLLAMLAKKCKTKGGVPALKKMFEKKRDLYMSSDEALKFGLIDRIGVPTLHRKLSVEWGLLSPTQHKEGQKDNEQPTRKQSKAERTSSAHGE